MAEQVHIFGVRHHGPGCARSLKAALAALKPDCVLIEGPPEADEIVALAGNAKLKPPVALLIYAVEKPQLSAFYPFAVFSPEWQALQYAVKKNVPVRFMDLPLAHRFALDEKPPETPLTSEEDADAAPAEDLPQWIRHDPLQHLAEAAGYADGELWWDHLVEHRRAPGDLFAAIHEAMSSVREAVPPIDDRHEAQREAHMRTVIRAAMKEGFERIAVICGAWHAPVLTPAKMPPAKDDDALLKGLPKIKTAAAWVPWSYGRLTFASGYGAGIASPGWYHHLFNCDDDIAIHWVTKVARLLRREDLDASSAHVIETVRLAETLAAVRHRPVVSLDELTEATRSVLCFGDTAPLALIHQRLIVSETLGEVPDDGAVAPLQLDLSRQQKRLRMPADAGAKDYELDLRKQLDLERSEMLHRLALLNVPWGERATAGNAKGTFKEIWHVQWQPEYAIRLIEAGIHGNTLYDAATGAARRAAAAARELPPVTALLDQAIQASLPEAANFLMRRVETLAAVAADVAHMMQALPALANIVRYGNVRKTDTSMVSRVVDGLLTRIVISLPGACASLDDQAAADMDGHIRGMHEAVLLLQVDEQLNLWTACLRQLADQQGLHGLLAGRCVRLLLDGGHINADEAATRMSFALSVGADPAFAAAWVEGFLKGSGLVLLHDERLWSVVDAWVATLPADQFALVLPLLRRSFSQFAPPERKQMGRRVQQGAAGSRSVVSADIDPARAAKVLPVLRTILGLPQEVAP